MLTSRRHDRAVVKDVELVLEVAEDPVGQPSVLADVGVGGRDGGDVDTAVAAVGACLGDPRRVQRLREHRRLVILITDLRTTDGEFIRKCRQQHLDKRPRQRPYRKEK